MQLNHQNAEILHCILHRIMNPANEGQDIISMQESGVISENFKPWLLKYCLNGLNGTGRFRFKDPDQGTLASQIQDYFELNGDFQEMSVKIAQHLKDVMNHPAIKDGDLMMVHLENLEIDGEPRDGFGLFKIETREQFAGISRVNESLEIAGYEGLAQGTLDKSCLIIPNETGQFDIYIYEKGGKSMFWSDEFLGITADKDEFHQTRNFMQMTRQFVTEHLQEAESTDKTAQIDLLNRSMEYFRNHDAIDQEVFAQKVISQPEMVESFKEFGHRYCQENDVYLDEKFDISNDAVKKQSRVFKSVLKLDRNFHVYIHGDHNLIEKGVDMDGRKFYKIYFNEEH